MTDILSTLVEMFIEDETDSWHAPLTDGWLLGSPPDISERQARERAFYYKYNYDEERKRGAILPHVEFVDTYNAGRKLSTSCRMVAYNMGKPLSSSRLEQYWTVEKRKLYLSHLCNNVCVKAFVDDLIPLTIFIGLLRSMMTELLRPTLYRLSLEIDKNASTECVTRAVKLMLRGNQLDVDHSPLIKPYSLHPEGNHKANLMLNVANKPDTVCYAADLDVLSRVIDVTAVREFSALKNLLCALVVPDSMSDLLCLDSKEYDLIDLVGRDPNCLQNKLKLQDACVSVMMSNVSLLFISKNDGNESVPASYFLDGLMHSFSFRAPMTLSAIESNGFDVTKCPELHRSKDVMLVLYPPLEKKPCYKKKIVLCETKSGVRVAVDADKIPNVKRKAVSRLLKRIFISIMGSYGKIHLVCGRTDRTLLAFTDKSHSSISKPFAPHTRKRKRDSDQRVWNDREVKFILSNSKEAHGDVVQPNNRFNSRALCRIFGDVDPSFISYIFNRTINSFEPLMDEMRLDIVYKEMVKKMNEVISMIERRKVEGCREKRVTIKQMEGVKRVRDQCEKHSCPLIRMREMIRQVEALIEHAGKSSLRIHVRLGHIRGETMANLWCRPYDPILNEKLILHEVSDEGNIHFKMVEGADLETLARDITPRTVRHALITAIHGTECAKAVSALNCMQWKRWSENICGRRRNMIYHKAKMADMEKDRAFYQSLKIENPNEIFCKKFNMYKNKCVTKKGRMGVRDVKDIASCTLNNIPYPPIVREFFRNKM